MRRVRRYGNRWKDIWPFKRFFPSTINERFCSKCSLPYQDGAMPKEQFFDSEGSLGYSIYPSGSFRKNERVAVFGRWKAFGSKFDLSPYIPVEELPDLLILVQKALEQFPQKSQTRTKWK